MREQESAILTMIHVSVVELYPSKGTTGTEATDARNIPEPQIKDSIAFSIIYMGLEIERPVLNTQQL